MEELDDPPLWTKYICAIQELTNDKSPGLNGVPPNAFKSMSEETYAITSTSSPNSGRIKSNLKNGRKAKLYQYLRTETSLIPTNREE